MQKYELILTPAIPLIPLVVIPVVAIPNCGENCREASF